MSLVDLAPDGRAAEPTATAKGLILIAVLFLDRQRNVKCKEELKV